MGVVAKTHPWPCGGLKRRLARKLQLRMQALERECSFHAQPTSRFEIRPHPDMKLNLASNACRQVRGNFSQQAKTDSVLAGQTEATEV